MLFRSSHAEWLASRPEAAEEEAIALMLRLAEEHEAHVHIVHLSAASALRTIAAARKRGVPLSVETCPHYLLFAAEEVPDGATEYKCAPPIREEENREKLWDALREGLVDQVVTDHSPSTVSLKCSDSGDFMKAWGGISSLQLGLAAVWTGARARGASVEDVSRWMCAAPARLAGLAATVCSPPLSLHHSLLRNAKHLAELFRRSSRRKGNQGIYVRQFQ